MQTLWAVIQELIQFAFELCGVSKSITVQEGVMIDPSVASEKVLSLPPVLQTTPLLGAPAISRNQVSVGTLPFASSSAYVVVDEARVWQRPVLTFDGDVWHVPYGTKVSLGRFEGRFAEVTTGPHHGWVLKDDISTIATDVFASFNTGEIYSANHPETKKVRRYCRDEFAAEELYLPLQDVEFVSYELRRLGRTFPWDTRRPRIAGRWQQLLRGQPGIQIGITPKTGSVFELVREDGTGFVAFLTGVAVDETITIAGVGRLIEGEYRLEVLPKSVWQEWRPVFIQVL